MVAILDATKAIANKHAKPSAARREIVRAALMLDATELASQLEAMPYWPMLRFYFGYITLRVCVFVSRVSP